MAFPDAAAAAEPLRLVRPDGISDASWQAISAYIDRVRRAIDAGDLSQTVGAAKDLAEAVGKSVLTLRGEIISKTDDYSSVINRAHVVLGRQPGPELSDARELRDVMQPVRQIASQLAPLRNSFGTGHGRAQDPEVTEEISQVCVDAALLWVRWALRRLGVVAQGLPIVLINDLDQGTTFYAGDLTERLRIADLINQEEPVQRSVGVAIGHRAMRDTFNVRIEGIQACAEASDPAAWPDAYRQGAFEALFLDEHEQLVVGEVTVAWAARLIASARTAQETIEELTRKVDGLAFGRILSNADDLFPRLIDSERFLPSSAHSSWRSLMEVLIADR